MTSTPHTGAIHDIGYRHYDGPRLGPGAVWVALFVHSLRGAYGFGRSARSKVMPLLLLVVMLVPPLIIAAVVVIANGDRLPVRYPEYLFHLQVVIAVFVAAQAPQSVSRDLRFRVVSLYFSRPLTRTAYVQAKYAAFAAAVFVLCALPLTVLYAGALLAQLDFWQNTEDYLTALVGAAVLAVVLAGFGLVIAAFTPRRGLGVAAVVSVLLIAAAVSGTIQGIAHEQHKDALSGYAGLISPFSLADGFQVALLGAAHDSVTGPPGGTGKAVFVAVTVLVVAACYGLLVLRYRRVSLS